MSYQFLCAQKSVWQKKKKREGMRDVFNIKNNKNLKRALFKS